MPLSGESSSTQGGDPPLWHTLPPSTAALASGKARAEHRRLCGNASCTPEQEATTLAPAQSLPAPSQNTCRSFACALETSFQCQSPQMPQFRLMVPSDQRPLHPPSNPQSLQPPGNPGGGYQTILASTIGTLAPGIDAADPARQPTRGRQPINPGRDVPRTPGTPFHDMRYEMRVHGTGRGASIREQERLKNRACQSIGKPASR